MARILNQSSGNVTLDINGDGSYTIPATSADSLLLIYFLGGVTEPFVSTTDGNFTVSSRLAGASADRNIYIAYREHVAAGRTAISFTGGDASGTLGVLYIEYFGLVSTSAAGSLGTWASNGQWTSASTGPVGNYASGLLVSLVFSEPSGDILTGRDGSTHRLTFSPSGGHTLGIADKEITNVSGSYTTQGTALTGGAQGDLFIFRTSAPIVDVLWARSAI